jgi:hemoglobin
MSDTMDAMGIPAEGTPAQQAGDVATFYDGVGGEATFSRLVHEFYSGILDDPVLGPSYADSDLAAAEERLRMFLMQYWGGPRTYSQQRGHPRLRMRHVAFRVGIPERDAWLRRMRAAMDLIALPQDADEMLWNYFVMAADSLVNAPEEPLEDASLLPLAADPPA